MTPRGNILRCKSDLVTPQLKLLQVTIPLTQGKFFSLAFEAFPALFLLSPWFHLLILCLPEKWITSCCFYVTISTCHSLCVVAHAVWNIFLSLFHLRYFFWSFGTQVGLYLLLEAFPDHLALWASSPVSVSPACKRGWGTTPNVLCKAIFSALFFLLVQAGYIQRGSGAMVPSDVGCDLQVTLPAGTNTWERYPGENSGWAFGEASCLLRPLAAACQNSP